jgi:hypothetical protein
VEELGRLPFERVPDELEDPADDEQRERKSPCARDDSDAANSAIETPISGMPIVWQKRLTGC